MSLRSRQRWFAVLTVFILAALAAVAGYIVFDHYAALAAANTPLPDGSHLSTSAAFGILTTATANELAVGAVALALGVPALVTCWLVAWRCNVRLREDAYHAAVMSALAALVRQGRA